MQVNTENRRVLRLLGQDYDRKSGGDEVFGVDVLAQLGELNWVFMIASGIWFSAVCLIKMIETALRANMNDE